MTSKSIPFCRYVCLLLLWLGTATTAFPQLLAYDTPEQRQQSLNAALKELETQHQVNFTYRSEITDGKFVDPSKLTDNQASLDDKLDYLLLPFGLQYKRAEDTYYLIYPKAKLWQAI